jgi:hypothetical protein
VDRRGHRRPVWQPNQAAACDPQYVAGSKFVARASRSGTWSGLGRPWPWPCCPRCSASRSLLVAPQLDGRPSLGPLGNATDREPWNKGKIVRQKAPFKVKDIRALRVRLQMKSRVRELALFNLGIDSKLRACDLVALKVRDVCHGDLVAHPSRKIQHSATARPAPTHPPCGYAPRPAPALRICSIAPSRTRRLA